MFCRILDTYVNHCVVKSVLYKTNSNHPCIKHCKDFIYCYSITIIFRCFNKNILESKSYHGRKVVINMSWCVPDLGSSNWFYLKSSWRCTITTKLKLVITFIWDVMKKERTTYSIILICLSQAIIHYIKGSIKMQTVFLYILLHHSLSF